MCNWTYFCEILIWFIWNSCNPNGHFFFRKPCLSLLLFVHAQMNIEMFSYTIPLKFLNSKQTFFKIMSISSFVCACTIEHIDISKIVLHVHDLAPRTCTIFF
jgi:hypothetical protein